LKEEEGLFKSSKKVRILMDTVEGPRGGRRRRRRKVYSKLTQ
jgi:hypothetical protein